TVLVGRRIIDELSEHRDVVEARLALGRTATEAARPHLRAAVRTALIPQIETTKAVGIVFLPGTMVGLILAGADPLAAVRVSAGTGLAVGSDATPAAAVSLGGARRGFPRGRRLVRRHPARQ